ncbi:MAG: MoxR family ATPase [Thermoanaerobaculia bacterium]|nr:MoxR family ATPase [Thermoanaerobaculia bacterium]
MTASSTASELIASSHEVAERLAKVDYYADADLATAIFLALRLGKPLLLEGEAGVGKTEVAKAIARILDTQLIRLQCYEGLDVHTALYEWDYSRQLLHVRLLEAAGAAIDVDDVESGLFRRQFLLARPLLRSLEAARKGDTPAVLLIDELDRADEEFEAFLLELLSDFQVSIPELGTVRAEVRPIVVLTSNRTREVRDALRRRCLYQWIEYPDADKEFRILRAKVPEAGERLTRQIVAFVEELRRGDLYKRPGVAESLDWALALHVLDAQELTLDNVNRTLGALLKYQDDLELVRSNKLEELMETSAV